MGREVFEYNSIATGMTTIGSIKNSAKKTLDEIKKIKEKNMSKKATIFLCIYETFSFKYLKR